MNFNSKKELYLRVFPVLRIRVAELSLIGVNLSEEQLFDLLSKEKWVYAKNLTLADIVSDIFKYQYRGGYEI